MDWLQFISAIIGHLAWPSVIIVLLIVLRHHVGALADRLEEFSFGGAKFIWKKTLREGREIIEQLPAPASLSLPTAQTEVRETPKPSPESSGLASAVRPGSENPEAMARSPERTRQQLQRFERNKNRLFKLTTVGAIITAYGEVEASLFEIGDAIGTDAAKPSSIMSILLNRGLVSDEVAELYKVVSAGRNLVAHSKADPSHLEVREYVSQAERLKNELQMIKISLQNKNSK